MNLLIRPLEDKDYAPIAALNNIYIRTTVIHFGYEPVSEDEIREQHKKAADRYPWVVAEIDGIFAGYAKAGVWRERTAYSWTPEAGIYVMPDFHRRGIGKALYGSLIDAVRARGFESLLGGITLPNAASVALHESMGFVKVAHVARAGWKFGAWHDVGFWQLILGQGVKPPGASERVTGWSTQTRGA